MTPDFAMLKSEASGLLGNLYLITKTFHFSDDAHDFLLTTAGIPFVHIYSMEA